MKAYFGLFVSLSVTIFTFSSGPAYKVKNIINNNCIINIIIYCAISSALDCRIFTSVKGVH